MSDPVMRDVLDALSGARHKAAEAVYAVPHEAGMYALRGDTSAWVDLGLTMRFDDQPLYIGKAERNLNSRDVGTHFAAGRTGSSTVRRSLAALLHQQLELIAVPRGTASTRTSSSFALDDESERRLSAWMTEHLVLSTWASPADTVLSEVEADVIRELDPPLNLTKVLTPRARLSGARRHLAEVARGALHHVPDAPPTAFEAPAAPDLSGEEPFVGLDASVRDFWRFTMSDLRTNNVRGYLAEYLVARAVGAADRRVEWDAWDVTGPDGTRIEVKSSAFLQSWAQTRLSTPSFRVAAASSWNATGWSSEKAYNAEVYVFCLQTARSHSKYDPLDVAQWVFYVLSMEQIESAPTKSFGLRVLETLAGQPVPYEDLAPAIAAVSPAGGAN